MKAAYNLGQKVKFIRVTPEGETIDGEGTITAILLSPHNRINYRIKTGENVFNIDDVAINPTKAGRVSYVQHIKNLRSAADKFNGMADQAIKDGHAEVERLNIEFLGPQVEIET